jgi:aryl-alcohol dehydrogenase-like predicted oxidoreductase
MEALMDLKAEGKIRAIGCSNATPSQMDEYRKYGDLDADQELYSMLDREQENSNLPYVAENNMAFLAYSPLAQGLLTGKVGPERTFEEGDQRRESERFSVENRKRVQHMLKQFQPIADEHGISMAQLTLAWTFSQHGCSHVLAGARNPKQAMENAAAGDVELSDDELREMDKIIEDYCLAISSSRA